MLVELELAQYRLTIYNAYLGSGQVIVMEYINKLKTSAYQNMIFLAAWWFLGANNMMFANWGFIDEKADLHSSTPKCVSTFSKSLLWFYLTEASLRATEILWLWETDLRVVKQKHSDSLFLRPFRMIESFPIIKKSSM